MSSNHWRQTFFFLMLWLKEPVWLRRVQQAASGPVVIPNATLGQMYADSINFTREYLFQFQYNYSQVGSGTLRVYVESDDSVQETPVLVVVRHEKGVLSWQLPLLLQRSVGRGSGSLSEYRSANRTLCPLEDYVGAAQPYRPPYYTFTASARNLSFDERADSTGSLLNDLEKIHYLSISISTASQNPTGFKLLVYIEENFEVVLDEERQLIATPSAPQYYQFVFPEDLDMALIKVDSPDELCMIVSVQNITCPVADLEDRGGGGGGFEGIRQTVDRKSGLTIRRDLFPAGLHVVFIVKPDDVDCQQKTVISPSPDCHGPCRNKRVTFSIVRKITPEEYLIATFGAFGMFVGAYLIVILVSCLLCVRRRRVILGTVAAAGRSIEATSSSPPPPPPRRISSRYGSLSTSNSSLESAASAGPTRRRPKGGRRQEAAGELPAQPPPPLANGTAHHISLHAAAAAATAGSQEPLAGGNADDIVPTLADGFINNGYEEEDGCGDAIRAAFEDDFESAAATITAPSVIGPLVTVQPTPQELEAGLAAAATRAPLTEDLEGIDAASSTDSSLDETDIDMLEDAEHYKEIFRTKTYLFVSDLARKHHILLKRRAMMYHWNLLTIAIFYALPVIQLVVTYQQVLNQTGNEDLCYYNFLCAHPLGLLSDFNHVYSNIGYVMLGGLFMVFVWRREYMHSKLVEENAEMTHMGIPQHMGLFYAMGLALIVEGIMSGCYHICPNHSNFQFDTAFMYTIAILCMLKIYQFRHPDINANAYTAFGVLAFVIFLGVLGVVNGSVTFWIFFTGCHVVTCLILSIQIYYMGRWKFNAGLCRRMWMLCCHDVASVWTGRACHAFKPTYPDRMVLLLLWNLANWGLSIYGIIILAQEGGDFAGFLLAVFIINLMLYTLFYILMKLRYGEKICRQPLTYIILACLCWAPAMYFFLNKSTTWNMSPAQSRQFNQECRLFHFYDNHDIWHFLSATSLFLSFMILLTLDDDLVEKRRDKIPVF